MGGKSEVGVGLDSGCRLASSEAPSFSGELLESAASGTPDNGSLAVFSMDSVVAINVAAWPSGELTDESEDATEDVEADGDAEGGDDADGECLWLGVGTAVHSCGTHTDMRYLHRPGSSTDAIKAPAVEAETGNARGDRGVLSANMNG